MARRSFHEVAVLLHESDNLVVLKKAVKAGDELVNGSVTLQVRQNIGTGHKMALKELPNGEPGRHAQLRGRDLERELFGFGLPLHPGPVSDGAVRARLSERGWSGGVHAQR